MTIPSAWFDQLRDRLTLSTIISNSGVPLKKKGSEYTACCPFHSEKSPSFFVNDSKAFYHCFGCGAHGDVLRWMTDHEGMQFMDAVKELAGRAGMDVPAADPRAAEREKAKEGQLDILLRVQQAFERELTGGSQAAEYLLARNCEISQIRKFGIGFAPQVAWGAKPFAADIGPIDFLINLGVLRKGDDGRVSDFFRNRITIPIHDARGRVVGWGGRIIGKGEPKYLNSPDTPVFDKGRTLFNLHRASPAARAKNRLVIVEGYFDVIGMDAVGIEEVVAPNGTALTEAQILLAWKLVDQPIVCLDGDKAGIKAAMRAALRALPILEPGKGLRFAFPPEGMDPDDIARLNGAEGVSGMLSSTLGISDLLWRDYLDQAAAGPEAQAKARVALRQHVETIKNQDVANAFYDDFRVRLQANDARSANTRRPAPARRAVNDAVEDAVFRGIIRHIDRIGLIAEDLATVAWKQDDVGAVIDALLWADGETAINRGNMVEALERRGLGEHYRVAMSRDALRFPFTVGTATDETLAALRVAIRALPHK